MKMKAEKEKMQPVRGVRITDFNWFMIAVACILYAALLYLTVQVYIRYDAMNTATEDYIRCEEDAAMVRAGSDDLTEAVRMYVVTEDLKWAKAYFEEANVNRSRDRGLEDLETFHPDDEIHRYLQMALKYSNDLMEREIYAMALVARANGTPEEKLPAEMQAVELTQEDLALDLQGAVDEAEELVFGTGYQDAKALIMNNIEFCLNSTLSEMKGQHTTSTQELHAAISQQRLCVTLLFIMTVLVFILITALIVRPLHIYIKNIGENKTLQVIGSYEFKYLALTYNSIYELNNANEEMLRTQAEQDALTGIMNRGSFDRLQESLKDRPVPVTLTLVDVDRFKEINDTCGHAVGDQVLKKVAQLLHDSFRSTDFIFRLGGDEFCVVMTEVSEGLDGVIGRKISEVNTLLHERSDGLPAVSLSVGVASSDKGLSNALYRRADKALYFSKENGRGRCTFYDDLPEEPSQTFEE